MHPFLHFDGSRSRNAPSDGHVRLFVGRSRHFPSWSRMPHLPDGDERSPESSLRSQLLPFLLGGTQRADQRSHLHVVPKVLGGVFAQLRAFRRDSDGTQKMRCLRTKLSGIQRIAPARILHPFGGLRSLQKDVSGGVPLDALWTSALQPFQNRRGDPSGRLHQPIDPLHGQWLHAASSKGSNGSTPPDVRIRRPLLRSRVD